MQQALRVSPGVTLSPKPLISDTMLPEPDSLTNPADFA
jgi:hypothetical protein